MSSELNKNNQSLPEEKFENFNFSETIAKLQKDTQELINRTIDGQPAQVSVVKVSDNKIIIEVDLNKLDLLKSSLNKKTESDDCSKNQNKDENEENINDKLSDKCKKQYDENSISSNKSNQINQQEDNNLNLNKNDGHSNSENDYNDQCVNNLDSSLNDKPIKGILKYSNSWKKRTLSESSFDNTLSFTDHEDENDCLSLSNYLSGTELDSCTDKASKKVTFNKKIFKSTFSKNSCIMNKKQRKDFRIELNKHQDTDKTKKQNTEKKNKKAKRKSSKFDENDVKLGKIQLEKSIENKSNEEKSNEDKITENEKNESEINESKLNEKQMNEKIKHNKGPNKQNVLDSSAIDDLSFVIYSSDSDVNASFSKSIQELNADNFNQNTGPHDKENWLELKSKKNKKNRKRHNSDSNYKSNEKNSDLSLDVKSVHDDMSLDIKNLEIQVN